MIYEANFVYKMIFLYRKCLLIDDFHLNLEFRVLEILRIVHIEFRVSILDQSHQLASVYGINLYACGKAPCYNANVSLKPLSENPKTHAFFLVILRVNSTSYNQNY